MSRPCLRRDGPWTCFCLVKGEGNAAYVQHIWEAHRLKRTGAAGLVTRRGAIKAGPLSVPRERDVTE